MVNYYSENVSNQANGDIRVCYLRLFFFLVWFWLYRTRTRGSILVSSCPKDITLIDWTYSLLDRKHFEFFPHQFRMESPQVRSIRREFVCYIGGKSYTTSASAKITRAKQKPQLWVNPLLFRCSGLLTRWIRLVHIWLLSVRAHISHAHHPDDWETESLANNEIIEETGIVFCCTCA